MNWTIEYTETALRWLQKADRLVCDVQDKKLGTGSVQYYSTLQNILKPQKR